MNSFELLALPILSPETCSILVDQHLSNHWVNGTVGTNSKSFTYQDLKKRKCKVTPLRNDDILFKIIETANRLYHSKKKASFTFHKNDPPIILFYEQNDFFDWHVDVGQNDSITSERKISFSVQLSNPDKFSGGDLEFDTTLEQSQRDYLRLQGNIIFFPSDIPHKITPIVSGIRYSLVGWLYNK